MKKLIIVAIIFCSFFATKVALAQCYLFGGGGSEVPPVGAGRKIGSNQWIQLNNIDGTQTFAFAYGTFSGYLYDGVSSLYGFTDRHVLEGGILSTNNGPQSCNQTVNTGNTGPCPNTVEIPDACAPYWDLHEGFPPSYPTRTFGNPYEYASLSYGALTSLQASDVGLIKLSTLSEDFIGSEVPPFGAGSFDNNLPQVATNPYVGGLEPPDEVIVDLKDQGLVVGNIVDVTNNYLFKYESGIPFTPTYTLYPTYLRGGEFIIVHTFNGKMSKGDSGAPLYTFKTTSANSRLCHQLIGTLVAVDTANKVGIFQSFSHNIQPSLRLVAGYTYTPAGSCVATGPVTSGGNIDNDGFTLNTPCNIDLAFAAQTNIMNFLNSDCPAPNSKASQCGTNTWGSVITAAATINSEDMYMSSGYSNTVANIAQPYLHVDNYCPSSNQCDSNLVKTNVLAAVNSKGTAVSTALTNWGIPGAAIAASQMVTIHSTLPEAGGIEAQSK